jgi:hypothetical protein
MVYPISIQHNNNIVEYVYPILGFQSALGDPFATLGDTIHNLLKYPLPSLDYKLNVPSLADQENYVYTINAKIKCAAGITNAANDYYLIPVDVLAFGNVPTTTPTVFANGAPLQNAFVGHKDSQAITQHLNELEVQSLNVEIATNLINLQATTIFTPTGVNNDWILRAYLAITVLAVKKRGTN